MAKMSCIASNWFSSSLYRDMEYKLGIIFNKLPVKVCLYPSLKIVDCNFAVAFNYSMLFRHQLRNPGSDVCIDTLAANEHGSFPLGL